MIIGSAFDALTEKSAVGKRVATEKCLIAVALGVALGVKAVNDSVTLIILQKIPGIRYCHEKRNARAEEVKQAESRAEKHQSNDTAVNEGNSEVARYKYHSYNNARVRAESEEGKWMVYPVLHHIEMLREGDDKRALDEFGGLNVDRSDLEPARVVALGNSVKHGNSEKSDLSDQKGYPELVDDLLIIDHRKENHNANARKGRRRLHLQQTKSLLVRYRKHQKQAHDRQNGGADKQTDIKLLEPVFKSRTHR